MIGRRQDDRASTYIPTFYSFQTVFCATEEGKSVVEVIVHNDKYISFMVVSSSREVVSMHGWMEMDPARKHVLIYRQCLE